MEKKHPTRKSHKDSARDKPKHSSKDTTVTKKDGAGGKGTWGSDRDGIKFAGEDLAVDSEDPNFDTVEELTNKLVVTDVPGAEGIEDTRDHRSYSKSLTDDDLRPSQPSLQHMPSPQKTKCNSYYKYCPNSGSLNNPDISNTVNPAPQQSSAPSTTEAGTNGDKLVVVMVGLPGRGKTYISRKLAHYLQFFHGAPAEVFNISNYRRKIVGAEQPADFFAPTNEEGKKQRKRAFLMAMQDLKAYMLAGTELGRIGIFDGTNSTQESRMNIWEELKDVMSSKTHVIYIESIVEDGQDMENNIAGTKLMPDYEGHDAEKAARDFKERIKQYLLCYETIQDKAESEFSWIKLVDMGRQVTANNIRGYLQTRVLQFVMSIQTTPRPIYLSRHGQSEYNKLGKIGGDSELSAAGNEYAQKLAEFVEKRVLKDNAGNGSCNPAHARLWTSSLKRTISTAALIQHTVDADGWVSLRPRVWRNLDELYAGPFDGMTYAEIEAEAPEEFAERRRNKLGYRYPRGESYLDVIARLEMVINELERQRDPVLIVGHQGVLRIIYCYLKGISREDAPVVDVPLNTVIKVVPRTYDCDEERFVLIPAPDGHAPSH